MELELAMRAALPAIEAAKVEAQQLAALQVLATREAET